MKLAILLLLGFTAINANAAWITLEPDDVAAGTDVTNYWDGVTLRAVEYRPGGTYVFSRVYADTSGLAVTGTNVFTNRGGATVGWQGVLYTDCVFTLSLCGPPFHALLLEFEEPVAAVSIASWFGIDGGGLWLYDENHQLVSRCADVWGMFSNPCYQYLGAHPTYGDYFSMTATSAVANVRYAIAGGIIIQSGLDAISYSVPEPSGLALLSLVLQIVSRQRFVHYPSLRLK